YFPTKRIGFFGTDRDPTFGLESRDNVFIWFGQDTSSRCVNHHLVIALDQVYRQFPVSLSDQSHPIPVPLVGRIASRGTYYTKFTLAGISSCLNPGSKQFRICQNQI